MKGTFTIVDGKSQGKTLAVTRPGVFSIGRSRQNALRIADASVSRVHCRIEFDGQFFWLIDCDSANGTLVNKRRVTKYLMYDEDVVKVGRIHVLFKLNGEAPG